MVVMIFIEDAPTLLIMLKDCCRSAFRCCAVCVSQFPLPLPLLDCVPVVVVLVVLGGKDVMVTKMLTEDVLALLIMIKYCWGKQTKTTS